MWSARFAIRRVGRPHNGGTGVCMDDVAKGGPRTATSANGGRDGGGQARSGIGRQTHNPAAGVTAPGSGARAGVTGFSSSHQGEPPAARAGNGAEGGSMSTGVGLWPRPRGRGVGRRREGGPVTTLAKLSTRLSVASVLVACAGVAFGEPP